MGKRDDKRVSYQKPTLEQLGDWTSIIGLGISRSIDIPQDFDDELFDNN
jgi:hypothetical protein